MAAIDRGLVCAIHPTAKGFGWVLFENPHAPYDWGGVYARVGRNEHILKRYARLLDRHEPMFLVIEEFERAGKGERIRSLCRDIIEIARSRGIGTAVYRRDQIQACFSHLGETTRYGIARTIADSIPALSHRMPKQRKPWVGDDERQSLFDAAALAITHYAVRSRLFPS